MLLLQKLSHFIAVKGVADFFFYRLHGQSFVLIDAVWFFYMRQINTRKLLFAYIYGMRPKKIFSNYFSCKFYYSGILYPVFMTNAITSALQIYLVVPVCSSSYNQNLKANSC